MCYSLAVLCCTQCRLPGSDGTWMVVRGGMGVVTQQLAAAAMKQGARIHTGKCAGSGPVGEGGCSLSLSLWLFGPAWGSATAATLVAGVSVLSVYVCLPLPPTFPPLLFLYFAGQPVEQILVEGGVAKGVVTKQGAEKRARAVLVNAGGALAALASACALARGHRPCWPHASISPHASILHGEAEMGRYLPE